MVPQSTQAEKETKARRPSRSLCTPSALEVVAMPLPSNGGLQHLSHSREIPPRSGPQCGRSGCRGHGAPDSRGAL